MGIATIRGNVAKGVVMKRTMFRGFLVTLAALTLAANRTPAAAQATADMPEATEVLARYVEAIGGRDAILSHDSRHARLFFKGPFAEAELFVYAAKPNKTVMGWESEGEVTSQSGFNGEVGWSIERDFGARILVGRELVRAREAADFYADLYDPEGFSSMETIELTEFEGKDCYKLKLVSKSGRETFEYFDAESGLKIGSEGRNQSGNYAFESSEILADYEDFGGVLIPTKRIWRYKGWPYEQVVTVTSLELDNVSDTVFALPAGLEKGSWPVADAIAELIELKPGQTVADIGAGAGLMSLELARRLDPTGQVLATEIDPDLVGEIRAQAAFEGLKNVSPVLSDQSFTGLPAVCCDAILLRFVYHEFTEPEIMNAEMLRALRPGGLVAVIDDAAEGDSLVNGRGNHNILPEVLIDEMVASGFELVRREDKWDGRESRFAVLLRRPSDND
jgi:SAM-dependent methyltransferase